MILSSDAGQTWTFNSCTGQIIFCAGILGDYNLDGTLDAEDLDLQAAAITGGPIPKDFVAEQRRSGQLRRPREVAARSEEHLGRRRRSGLVFDNADFVHAFQAGKYETATSRRVEGDWDGDLLFETGDFVAAFVHGGYEAAPSGAAVSAVPEPGSIVLALLGMVGLWSRTRRQG